MLRGVSQAEGRAGFHACKTGLRLFVADPGDDVPCLGFVVISFLVWHLDLPVACHTEGWMLLGCSGVLGVAWDGPVGRAVACVGERFCSWGFAELSAWPCPGAVLGHRGENWGTEEG